MACVGAAVIVLMSYSYTGKLQAVSPTNCLGTRLALILTWALILCLDSYKRVSSVCTVVLAQIYYHSAILLGKELTWPIAVWNIKFTKNSIQILHNSCRPLCNYDVWWVEYETMVVR